MTGKMTHSDTREPIYLIAIRAAVLITAVLLFVGPLASWIGIFAAVAAVPAGLCLSRVCARARLRTPVVAAAGAGLACCAFFIERAVGRGYWLPHLFSPTTALAVCDAVLFGLLVLGVVCGLRTLSAKFPTLAILEIALVAAAILFVFTTQQESQLNQPRFLTDWTFSRGHSLNLVLAGIGFLILGTSTLLLLQIRRFPKAVAAVALLLFLGIVGHAILARFLPVFSIMQVAQGSSGGQGNKKGSQSGQSGQSGEQNQSGQNGESGQASGNNQGSSGQSQGGGSSSGNRNQDAPDFVASQSPPQPSPMAIVSLHDDFAPPHGYYYFRQNAYSQFNGNRLVRAVDAQLGNDVPAEFPTRHSEVAGVPLNEKWHKLVPTTISLIAPHGRPIALESARTLEPRRNADPASFQRTYAVTSQVIAVPLWEFAGVKSGDASWAAPLWTHYLAFPDDPRYRELAAKIVAESIDEGKLKPELQKSPVFAALAFRRWIEKNTIYSLKSSHAGDEDPAGSFLFGDQRGYCVHVAHALAYLLRSRGIPSRVASGYAAEASRTGQGSSVLLQSTDAHSWCEMYLEGVGWVVVDASPERSEEPTPPGVDQAAQSHFGERNHDGGDERGEGEGEGKSEAGRGGQMVSNVLLGMLLVLLAKLYAIKIWRRAIPWVAPERSLYRLSYRATLDLLADLGFVRGFGETREEFAERLKTLAPEFGELTSAHMRKAYYGVAESSRGWWRGGHHKIAARLAGKVPFHRRAIGFLNPAAWLRVS